MGTRNILISILIAFAAGFGAGLLSTELLQDEIEFSLFVGIPVAIAVAGIAFAVAILLFKRSAHHADEPMDLGELR